MIKTKFIIATGKGIKIMERLITGIAREKLAGILSKDELDQYISGDLARDIMLKDNLAQWLIVLVDEEPAGCAIITSRGKRPAVLENKRIIRIAHFGVLHQFHSVNAQEVLMEKCLTTCRGYESIWMSEFEENPMMPLFEKNGFLRQHQTMTGDGFIIPTQCLIRKAAL